MTTGTAAETVTYSHILSGMTSDQIEHILHRYRKHMTMYRGMASECLEVQDMESYHEFTNRAQSYRESIDSFEDELERRIYGTDK